jgi:DNA-binding NarL/FixJ family response regulator
VIEGHEAGPDGRGSGDWCSLSQENQAAQFGLEHLAAKIAHTELREHRDRASANDGAAAIDYLFRHRPQIDALADREYQVMCLIALGKTVSESAGELSLSVKTISTYRRRILDKMHLNTNAELTHYAIRNHLVE